jgi:hypothetical protein
VTTQAAWSSSNSAVVTVSSTPGVAYVTGVGSAVISATFQGTTGTLMVSKGPLPCQISDRRVLGNPDEDATDVMAAKPAGGTYTLKFTITGAGNCAWTPTTYTGWLHAAGSGNVGDATVTVTVDGGGGRVSRVLLNFSGLNLVDASRQHLLVVYQGLNDLPAF